MGIANPGPRMRIVSSVARTVWRAYKERGPAGLLAASRYYVARTQAAVTGPGRRCPVCGWEGREFAPLFLIPDSYVRAGAICRGCGSQERQRGLVPALQAFLAAELGSRRVDILEVSPDPVVTRTLQPFARTYRASSYVDPRPGELQLDLHDLALPDEDLDVVVMTYVLCCVPDDLKAASSLFRVLRPGGLVIACEGFSHSGVHDEWGASGHGGGWRQYGTRDVRDRFPSFEVELHDVTGDLPASERIRRGVQAHEYMIVLRKPAH